MSAAFPGGVHFADLAQVTDPDDSLRRLPRVELAVDHRALPAPAGTPRRRRPLVIVDNCEHLIDDVAELVDRLLDDVPSLHLLATSREHLDLDGERVVTVGPLPPAPSPPPCACSSSGSSPSPPVRSRRCPADQIASICRRLDGIPLAIELAAGRARTMSLADIDRGLDDRFTLLAGDGEASSAASRRCEPRSTGRSISSTEPSGISSRASRCSPARSRPRRCGGLEAPLSAVGERLAALTGKSLVDRVADVDGEARFRLLETVREWGSTSWHAPGSCVRCATSMPIGTSRRPRRRMPTRGSLGHRTTAGDRTSPTPPRLRSTFVTVIRRGRHLLRGRMNQVVEGGFGVLGRDLQRAAAPAAGRGPLAASAWPTTRFAWPS